MSNGIVLPRHRFLLDGTKKKRGRPSTGFDKKSYMKEYMRKKRAEKKQNEKRA